MVDLAEIVRGEGARFLSTHRVTRDQYKALSDIAGCQTELLGTVLEAAPSLKLGIARDIRAGQFPLHGLRHPPESGTCGWFLWAGELEAKNPEFFAPVHVSHLQDSMAVVLPYLGLAPGWRFLVAPGYEDVWFDPQLMSI